MQPSPPKRVRFHSPLESGPGADAHPRLEQWPPGWHYGTLNAMGVRFGPLDMGYADHMDYMYDPGTEGDLDSD